MRDRLLIPALEEGSYIIPDSECYFLIKKSAVKTGKNNARYIDLELTDGTASINGKVWDVKKDIDETLAQGNIVKVLTGRVAKYQSNLQVIIEDAEIVPPEKLDKVKGIIPESPCTAQALTDRWAKLKERLDAGYRGVIDEIETHTKVWELFKSIPAGKSMHHAYRRGLWEHSLNVTELALMIAEKYEKTYPLNLQVVMLGSMIHDIGKIFEFQVNPSTSIVERYSDRGRLLGHVYMGTTFMEKIITKMMPEEGEIKMELLHIMLSHHGEYEFGSPKKPKTLEALIISMADNLDANLNSVSNGFAGEMEESWTKTIYSLNRAFYKTSDQ